MVIFQNELHYSLSVLDLLKSLKETEKTMTMSPGGKANLTKESHVPLSAEDF